jgi:hypothetical protein
MKENKLDQDIREKLQGREIQPSESAWERLSSQLDSVEEKKKKSWFLYLGYAASVALLISLFFLLNQENDSVETPKNILVEETVEEPNKNSNKDFLAPIPVENDAIVENTKSKVKEVEKVSTEKKPKKIHPKKEFNVNPVESESVIAKTEQNFVPKGDVQKLIKESGKDSETGIAQVEESKENSSTKKITKGITVDSDALLMSVTGTREELRAYYKKYKIDRQDVLLTIEKELKKSNLKIDPKTILAEVEQDVNEESFQNNFYQFIKKRVSNVATAIANRNN